MWRCQRLLFVRLYLRSEKIAQLQARLATLQQQQQQRLNTPAPSQEPPPHPTTVHVALPVSSEVPDAETSVAVPAAVPVVVPLAAPQLRCSVKDDFGRWVQMCNLSQWIQMELWEAHPDEQSWGRLPLLGMTPPMPHLDNSNHGRDYAGFLFHGTCFSQLPSILSAGILLRSAVPTRGFHAVWAAESKSRALHYSPPVKLNQVAIQCCLMIDARKVKASHFKTPDKQLMLREVWHGITYLYVCKASGTGAYRGTHPFGRFLPRFHWEQGFANWDALPAQWQVNTNTGPAASASTEGVPEIPRPS